MEFVLQKQDLVTTVRGCGADGNTAWLLEYYLQTHLASGKNYFGIKVAVSNPGKTLDSAAQAIAIADNANEVFAMIDLFAKNAIGPDSLSAMVKDWLYEPAS